MQSLMRVLPYVDDALASASDEELAELGLPGGWQRSQTKDFRLELGRGGMLRITLPQRINHRRWLITAAGHVLRRPPGRRRMLLPERTIKALACSWFSAWPSVSLHCDQLVRCYRFQKASTAFIRRRCSVVTYTVVVARDACPRFCCTISIGIPPAMA